MTYQEGYGMGGHQSHKMLKDEWLTPPHILKALGEFDLDPCAPAVRPWDMAKNHICLPDNGLAHEWVGRVWLNPPYGNHTGAWLSRLAEHGNGTALIFARTETADWFKYIWSKATAILFIEGRLYFHHIDGKPAKHNSGAPSALIAYGRDNAQALLKSKIKGRLVFLDQSVLVETSGGVINCIHSNDPNIKVDILDWDEFNEGANITETDADEMYQEYTLAMPFDLLAQPQTSSTRVPLS